MRLICAILVVALLGGCAAHRNRPVEPNNHYWPINKQVPTSGETKNG